MDAPTARAHTWPPGPGDKEEAHQAPGRRLRLSAGSTSSAAPPARRPRRRWSRVSVLLAEAPLRGGREFRGGTGRREHIPHTPPTARHVTSAWHVMTRRRGHRAALAGSGLCPNPGWAWAGRWRRAGGRAGHGACRMRSALPPTRPDIRRGMARVILCCAHEGWGGWIHAPCRGVCPCT